MPSELLVVQGYLQFVVSGESLGVCSDPLEEIRLEQGNRCTDKMTNIFRALAFFLFLFFNLV